MRSAVVMAGILCVAGLIAAAQEEPVNDYMGGQVCASCHPSIASTYREVGMARTFRSIADVPVIEDWTTNNRYFHRLLEEALEENESTTVEPYFSLASAYAELGRTDDSIEIYLKVIELDPGYAEAHYNLGLVHLGDRRFPEALELFDEAIRLQPNWADNYVVAGVAEAQLGRDGLARARYVTALDLDPLNTVALNNLGVLDLQVGNGEQAAAHFERVLQISPTDETAIRMLERLR